MDNLKSLALDVLCKLAPTLTPEQIAHLTIESSRDIYSETVAITGIDPREPS